MEPLDDPRWEGIQSSDLRMWGSGDGAVTFEASLSEEERLRLREMTQYEQPFWQRGICDVVGIDEVGRGPIAGPVVAAAVIVPPNALWAGINDSKKLSEKKRLLLEKKIKAHCLAWAIGAVGPSVIDEINILQATKLAMKQAVSKLPLPPEHLLIDAVALDLPLPQTNIVKGDAKSISIAAASIIAKCHRDRMMEVYDRVYPGYGLASHAGYPTKSHKEAVFTKGYTSIHRRSYHLKPIKK